MPRAKIALNDVSEAPAQSGPDVAALVAQIEQLRKEVKDSKQTAQVTSKQEEYKGPRSFSFKKLDGRPICSIKMLTNKVNRTYDSKGYQEDQTVELTFADGEKEKMTYLDFAQGYETSDKTFAYREEHDVEFELKNEFEKRMVNGHEVTANKKVTMDALEFEKRYMVNDRRGAKVVHWDVIKSLNNVSRYTFLIPDVNEGKEFTVDDSAIN